MTRALLVVAFCLLAAAPIGVAVGLGVAVGVGWGVTAGSLLYGAAGVWLLTADIVPDPREVSR